MVAYDVVELGLLAAALDAQEVVESLVALCGFGNLRLGNMAVELAGQAAGVDHLALGVASVHTHALDSDAGSGGIEVLIFQVADVAAVHGVGPLAAKLLHVEVVGALADFLVGVESHAYVAMLDLIMVAQIAHGLHNLSHAGLVVGTE